MGVLALALAACGGATESTTPTANPSPPTADTPSASVPSSSPTPSPATPAPSSSRPPTPTAPDSSPPTAGGSGPPPGPVATVTPVEPLPDGGRQVRLRPGEPVTVADGVTVELVALDPAPPGCDDCPNHATITVSTPESSGQADITIGGLMEPSVLEAARRLEVGSWVVRIEAFGEDHLDVRVVDLGG